MTEVWGTTHYGDAPLRSTIKRLRRKLFAAGVSLEIESVRGVGYRLEDRTATSLAPLT
jgi:DNA-binding response OmpR family regulator